MSFPGFNLQRWAGILRGRLITDAEGEDSATEAARALVEVLDAEHVERLADALLEVAPGLRERFSDQLIGELKEEIAQKEDPKHAHATVRLIEEIERSWKEQS